MLLPLLALILVRLVSSPRCVQALPAGITTEVGGYKAVPTLPAHERNSGHSNLYAAAAAAAARVTQSIVQPRKTGIPAASVSIDGPENFHESAVLPTPTDPPHAFQRRWINMCNNCKASTGVTQFLAASKYLTKDCHKWPKAKTTRVQTVVEKEIWTDDCLITVTRREQKNMCVLWVRQGGFAGSKTKTPKTKSTKKASTKTATKADGCRTGCF